MAYTLGVWTEREGGDWESCVISSYLEALVYGGLSNFPLGVYTQAERETLEKVPDEPQDYNTTDGVSLDRYGVRLRHLTVATIKEAVSRPGTGVLLAGYGALLIPTTASVHSVFWVGVTTTSGLVYDPLAANQTAGVPCSVERIVQWSKGAGLNDAREVIQNEFTTGDSPMFGNPVPGTIQARGQTWKGAPTFIVTSTFAEHVASGRGTGVDMGNGGEGAAVLAVADGVIKQAFKDPGNGAIIVRVDHGNGYVTGYAHLRAIETSVGIRVARGIAIGHVGSTGAPGQPHLHFGVNKNGVEIDGWPLLDQNIAQPAPSGGDMLQGTNPKQLNNKVVTITGDSTRLRAAPATGITPILAVYGAGTNFTPDWEVTGAAVGTATIWYGGWGKTDKGYEFGYLHSSVVGPLTDFAAGGITPAQLETAKKTAYNEGRGAVQAAAAGVPPKT